MRTMFGFSHRFKRSRLLALCIAPVSVDAGETEKLFRFEEGLLLAGAGIYGRRPVHTDKVDELADYLKKHSEI